MLISNVARKMKKLPIIKLLLLHTLHLGKLLWKRLAIESAYLMDVANLAMVTDDEIWMLSAQKNYGAHLGRFDVKKVYFTLS